MSFLDTSICTQELPHYQNTIPCHYHHHQISIFKIHKVFLRTHEDKKLSDTIYAHLIFMSRTRKLVFLSGYGHKTGNVKTASFPFYLSYVSNRLVSRVEKLTVPLTFKLQTLTTKLRKSYLYPI